MGFAPFQYMATAIEEARLNHKASSDHPVGAAIEYKDGIIAKGGNRCHQDQDPTAHAEIVVIREAGRIVGRKNLRYCTLYVTCEPCPMCAWAIVTARLWHVYYGVSRIVVEEVLCVPDEFRTQKTESKKILYSGDHVVGCTPDCHLAGCLELLRLCTRRPLGDLNPFKNIGNYWNLESECK